MKTCRPLPFVFCVNSGLRCMGRCRSRGIGYELFFNTGNRHRTRKQVGGAVVNSLEGVNHRRRGERETWRESP